MANQKIILLNRKVGIPLALTKKNTLMRTAKPASVKMIRYFSCIIYDVESPKISNSFIFLFLTGKGCG